MRQSALSIFEWSRRRSCCSSETERFRITAGFCYVFFAATLVCVGDPHPMRPTETNAQAIVRAGVSNSALIIAGKDCEIEGGANSRIVCHVEILRLFKVPPEFQARRILIGYLIGKHYPEHWDFKEKPHTNTFVLFLKDGYPWKGWYDATEAQHSFLEVNTENVRLVQEELGITEPSFARGRWGRIVIVATALITALLGLASSSGDNA